VAPSCEVICGGRPASLSGRPRRGARPLCPLWPRRRVRHAMPPSRGRSVQTNSSPHHQRGCVECSRGTPSQAEACGSGPSRVEPLRIHSVPGESPVRTHRVEAAHTNVASAVQANYRLVDNGLVCFFVCADLSGFEWISRSSWIWISRIAPKQYQLL